MKILLFHPVLLPPPAYGGIERVVLWLAKGLKERGHEVWVAAYPGSQLPEGVQLLATSPEVSDPAKLARRLPQGIDLVHFMAPPGAEVEKAFPTPWLLTVHGNGKLGERFPENSIFLSADHARRHGATAYVYNGIDPSEFEFSPAKKMEHWLFLSKTSWRVKNVAGASRIARRAKVSLEIAGGQRPWSVHAGTWFSPRQRWIGPVGGVLKRDVLSRARGLLFPVLWEEPFGLVVVEMLMSGGAIIASQIGSLPELVSADTGVLLPPPRTVAEEQTWVESFRRAAAQHWDAEACRARAMQLFHYQVMAQNYETYYRQILMGLSLHVARPMAAQRA